MSRQQRKNKQNRQLNGIRNQQRYQHRGKAFSVQQAKDQIKQGLFQMEDLGYDFRFKEYHFTSRQKKKKYLYRAYLRHVCHTKQCNNKRFTTTKGTAVFKFKFQSLEEFWEKNPQYSEKKAVADEILQRSILFWDFFIYRMQCRNCNIYAQPFIYDGELDKMIQRIKKLLANILKGIPPPPKIKREVKVPQLHGHQKQLCQACRQQVCDYANK